MMIYLDIDGVMVPANSWRKPEILEDDFPKFSAIATIALNKILFSSNAGIVLTTSHKHRFTLEEWKDIFRRRKISINKISRLPENTDYLNRKEEIINWFQDNDLGADFLIIDDDKTLNGLPDSLKKNLIQTSGSVGLTDNLADRALERIEKFKSISEIN
ncbi:MAG: HAD domain-containing protein [Leeuwenhoekiella sp.]